MSQYRFDVDANTKKAEKNINDLFKLLGQLDKAENKAGKIDDFANDNNVLDLLDNYKQLEGQYRNLSTAAQNYEHSSNFKGKTDDFQHFNDKLNKSADLLKQIGTGINSLGSSGGGSFKQYVKDTEQAKNNMGDMQKEMILLQRQNTRFRNLGNRMDRLSSRAVDSGYMSFRDLSSYTRDQAQVKKIPQVIDYNNGRLKDYQNQYSSIKEQIKSGLNTEGNRVTSDDLKSMHSQLRDLERVMKKTRSNNTMLEATKETGESADASLMSAAPLIASSPSKLAAAVLVAIKAGGALIRQASKDVEAGNVNNKNTGEEALNIGNVQGHVSDNTMRNRVQLLMRNNKLGYNTQEGLDYYSLAQQSRSFSAGHTPNNTVIGMTTALEEGGRSTGIAKQSWDSAVNAAMQAGGIFTDKDINRLSATIAGENMRSGNSGATEDNAKIITSAIQQLSRSTTLNQNGISYIGATASLMSRSSKLFSGEQGQAAISGLNDGFLNAASNKNDALLYLKIQSNPQRFGGITGKVNAQKELSQGLSNPDNMGFVQNTVNQLGEGAGTLFLEQQFGYDVNQANTMAKHMLDKRYSRSKLIAEAEKNEKAGNKQTQQNLNAYRNSNQSTYNQTGAQREARQSSMSSSLKWAQDAKNTVGNGINEAGRWVGDRANDVGKFVGGIGNNVGNFFGGIGRNIGNFFGGAGGKASGSGLLGTQTVHAATISKKDNVTKYKHKAKTTTGKTIDSKRQAESQTKSYLNTRNQEKNLRTERNNIDARKETISSFSRLLKEEKGGAKGTGTIGNGKISIDGSDVNTKDDSKKKKATKKPTGSDKKVKSGGSGGISKSLKNTNNITVNIPNGNTASARAMGDEVGARVAQAIERQSKVWIQGD